MRYLKNTNLNYSNAIKASALKSLNKNITCISPIEFV